MSPTYRLIGIFIFILGVFAVILGGIMFMESTSTGILVFLAGVFDIWVTRNVWLP